MSFFQDTTFGHVVRFISGGRIFSWKENHDEDARLQYIYDSGKPGHDASSGGELEKGNEYQLIDFLPDDPQVYCANCHG